jgi:hypothetical protein
MINAHSQSTFQSAPRAFCWLFIAAIGLQFLPNAAHAEETAKPLATALPKVTAAEPGPAGSPAPPVGSPTPLPKVATVKGLIKLHDTLEVDCDGLKEWAQTKTNDPSKLVLYLDGTVMKGLVPKIDKANANQLFFKLERLSGNDESKADNTKAWDALFSRPKGFGLKGGTVRVTVGPEPGLPFDSSQTATLYAIKPWGFLVYLVGFILLLIGIYYLGQTSNLLRDSGPEPAGGRKTYSLGRTQMAFWFFLIIAAYGFIFLVTGAIDTITPSVLGLMGISAGTGLAARAVDNSKRSQAQAELDKLRAEQAKLQGQQRLNALPGLIATQQANLDQLRAEQARLVVQQQAATEATPFSNDSLQRLNALTGLIATAQADLDQLSAEQVKLQGQRQAAAAPGATAFPPESLQRLNDLPLLIAAQQAIVDPIPTGGFIQDILSDADGISFHRLQIAVWTVVLGIIFCLSVYTVLSMPTFSDTLLGLLGISGGTYIGFKIPEKL